MSLVKSPTMTPAKLAANRRNARKSTGPRTARGKAQARLNGLRNGPASRLYHDVMLLLMRTPPDQLERTARRVLTPKEAKSKLYRDLIKMIHEADFALAMERRKANGLG